MTIDLAQQEAIAELHTVMDWIRWGTSRFHEANLAHGHGIDSAWDEAVALVMHAIHFPPEVPATLGNARLTTRERQEVVALLQRRIKERRPAAYLIGEAWFAGQPFLVDERVLIPRSPIAEWIEKGFSPWLADREVRGILDIGTGSGCIAIACAQAFPTASVDAVDLSEDALAVAALNVARYGLEEQVSLYRSDVYTALEGSRYDLIVTNPPYVPTAEVAELPAEYHHEPVLGLAAGVDGLAVALRILQGAARHLTNDGILVMEVGDSDQTLADRLPQVPFLWLDFQRGGGGVLLLTADQLIRHQRDFDQALSSKG